MNTVAQQKRGINQPCSEQNIITLNCSSLAPEECRTARRLYYAQLQAGPKGKDVLKCKDGAASHVIRRHMLAFRSMEYRRQKAAINSGFQVDPEVFSDFNGFSYAKENPEYPQFQGVVTKGTDWEINGPNTDYEVGVATHGTISSYNTWFNTIHEMDLVAWAPPESRYDDLTGDQMPYRPNLGETVPDYILLPKTIGLTVTKNGTGSFLQSTFNTIENAMGNGKLGVNEFPEDFKMLKAVFRGDQKEIEKLINEDEIVKGVQTRLRQQHGFMLAPDEGKYALICILLKHLEEDANYQELWRSRTIGKCMKTSGLGMQLDLFVTHHK